MHLQWGQIELRSPYPSNPDGWYYWQNGMHWDLDNPPDDNESLYWFAVWLQGVHSQVVQTHNLRVMDPPGSNIFTIDAPLYDDPGGLIISGGYSLLQTVLVYWKVGDRRAGYTRLRVPVPANGLVGRYLAGWFYDAIYGITVEPFEKGRWTDHTGVPFTGFEIDPLVRMWQLRHGTKRREREYGAG